MRTKITLECTECKQRNYNMTCCKDCIGAVSVVPVDEKEVSHV